MLGIGVLPNRYLWSYVTEQGAQVLGPFFQPMGEGLCTECDELYNDVSKNHSRGLCT